MKTEEISIQPGCKKVEIDFENNRVIAFYEEKQKFKRGDYLFDDGFIYILCEIESDTNCMVHIACYKHDGVLSLGDKWKCVGRLNDCIRFATPEEIALLDQKLLESSYKFNKETLELEKVEVFNDGETVIVRNEDCFMWVPALFKSKSNIGYITYTTSDNSTVIWKQCIKYSGNEHLLGTTNKPE